MLPRTEKWTTDTFVGFVVLSPFVRTHQFENADCSTEVTTKQWGDDSLSISILATINLGLSTLSTVYRK